MEYLKELKISRAKKSEVVMDTLDNLEHLELRGLLKSLLAGSNIINDRAYKYLMEEHKEKLIDSLIYNEVIKEG